MRRGLPVRMGAIATALVVSLMLGSITGCTQTASRPESSSAADSTREAKAPEPSSQDSSTQPTNPNMEAIHTALGTASTEFGFELLAALLAAEGETDNLLVSPSSVAIALMMAYNGAAGETQAAIANALQLPDANQSQLNTAYGDLLIYLEQAGDDVELAIANSLWVRQDVDLNSDFVETMQASFDAEVAALNFADTTTPDTINSWVSQKTKGNIPAIVESINPNMALFLINAIYFNGDWRFAFDPEQTSDRPFIRLDGSSFDHPLMEQTRFFDYLETDRLQAVRLPYGASSNPSETGDSSPRRISMTVVLPTESLSWQEFLTSLTAETWQSWQSQFSRQEGTLVLPRFNIEDQMPLNEPLKALGMAIAFDPSAADFSNLSDVSTVVSQVQHRTVVDVTETGTEAAASTSVGIAITSAPAPSTPFEMVVDRPFLFAISDETTQTLLFLGTVVNPQG